MRHLYQNSTVIYSAESLDECNKLFTEDMGESPEEMGDLFEQIPDDKPMGIISDEPTDEPGEVERTGKHGGRFWFMTKLAREWAEGFGSGHFSGGDY